MNIEILYRPSYSAARVTLLPGEAIMAEMGAMLSMSAMVQVETKMQGGLLQALSRSMLGGESFFLNTFRAPAGGEVMLAPTMPGDISVVEMTGEAWYVQSGSFLGSSEKSDTDASWSGAKTFFAGEGLFMLRCRGLGSLIISSYGAIHEVELTAGQIYTVDTGHLVAFPALMPFKVRTIGGLKATILGGEGLVVDLTGPGKIYLQTRSVGAFLGWLIPRLPKPSHGE